MRRLEKLDIHLFAIFATSAPSLELAIAARCFPSAIVDIFSPNPYSPYSLRKRNTYLVTTENAISFNVDRASIFNIYFFN